MSDRPAWEQSAAMRRQAAWIARVGAPLIGALGRTWRFTSEGADAYDQIVAAGQRPIMAFWHGRIWDRTQVPRPFTRVAVAVGPPYLVAADVDEAGLEQRRLDLEAELARLGLRATELLQGR